MPNIKYVTELDGARDYQPNLVFKFDLDDGKIFCYRSRVSYNSFAFGGRNNNKPRNRNNKFGKKLIYHCRDENDYKLTQQSFIRTFEMYGGVYEEPPMVELKNLWQFYNVIGYDYKSKKFVDTVDYDAIM